MTLINSQIEHAARQGPYSQPWITAENLAWQYTPAVYPEIIRAAGYRFDGLDFFNLYGGRLMLKNRELSSIVKGRFAAPVRVQQIEPPTEPGGDITITVLADDLDDSNRSQLRLKFTVAIPVGDSYELYRLHTREDVEQYTASPLEEDAYFEDAIAEGTELMVGHSLDTTGAAGVEGLRDRLYYYKHQTQISKERLGQEGGMLAQEEWADVLAPDGSTYKFSRWLNDVEKRLRKQIEVALWMGQQNTNEITSYNSIEAADTVVLGEYGLRKVLEQRGARLYYGDAFTLANTYSFKDHFINTELGSDMGVLLCDHWLLRDFERSGVEWLTANAGGTDYKRIYRRVFGAATDDMINVSFRACYIDGVLTTIVEIPSLSDPATFGASSLDAMHGQGIYVPVETGQVTLDGESKKLKNLSIGYLNNQGENRTRVFAVLDGMSGNTGNYNVVTDVDGTNVHLLTEYLPLILNPEQMILITKGDEPVSEE